MRMRKKKNLVPRMEACDACWIRRPEEHRGPLARADARRAGAAGGARLRQGALYGGDGEGRAGRAAHRGGEGAGRDGRGDGARAGRGADQRVFHRRRRGAPGRSCSPPARWTGSTSTSATRWPRSNQKKRRLTHGNFLAPVPQVLRPAGQIHFKTDNDKLFAWSVEEIPQFGFSLSEVTTDLHADALSA